MGTQANRWKKWHLCKQLKKICNKCCLCDEHATIHTHTKAIAQHKVKSLTKQDHLYLVALGSSKFLTIRHTMSTYMGTVWNTNACSMQTMQLRHASMCNKDTTLREPSFLFDAQSLTCSYSFSNFGWNMWAYMLSATWQFGPCEAFQQPGLGETRLYGCATHKSQLGKDIILGLQFCFCPMVLC